MREREDADGRLLLDHLEGRPAVEIVERDDGFIAANNSRDELRDLVAGTGWRVARFVDSDAAPYVAVLEREP